MKRYSISLLVKDMEIKANKMAFFIHQIGKTLKERHLAW